MIEHKPHNYQYHLNNNDIQREMNTPYLDPTTASSHPIFQDRLSSTYRPVTPSIPFNKDILHENKLLITIPSMTQDGNNDNTIKEQQEYLDATKLTTAAKDSSCLSPLQQQPNNSQQQQQQQYTYVDDLNKSTGVPNQQFIFSKPVYDSHYHSTHYNHLERHDSFFKGMKRLFSRNAHHGSRNICDTSNNLLVAYSPRSSKSDHESSGAGGGGNYSFGSAFNKDLKHHYGNWGTLVGKGSGGSVCVIRRTKDHKVFAVKEFRQRGTQESERAYIKKVTAEFCIGSILHHANIIETLDIIREGSSFYQIMEYVPYDMLTIVMNTHLSPAEMACCWRQLLNGVAYLHQVGIGHRDLKLDNMVMNEDNIVKIIDFGTATVARYPYETENRASTGIYGSDPYIAPEQYNQPSYNAFLADLWSCGIIYVCMVLHRFAWCVPRPAMDVNYQMYLNNRNSLLAYIPRHARPTIAHLLEPYPPDRYTMTSLLLDPRVASIETCTPHRHYQHHQPLPLSPYIQSTCNPSFLQASPHLV